MPQDILIGLPAIAEKWNELVAAATGQKLSESRVNYGIRIGKIRAHKLGHHIAARLSEIEEDAKRFLEEPPPIPRTIRAALEKLSDDERAALLKEIEDEDAA